MFKQNAIYRLTLTFILLMGISAIGAQSYCLYIQVANNQHYAAALKGNNNSSNSSAAQQKTIKQ
jgi:hypothetical protein